MLALIAALVGPYFVDWTNYRTAFEEQASRILGHKVEVRGRAKARLLPLPRIEFDDVRVGARTDGTAMMTVERFRVDAELAPLLKGEVVVVDMELQRPRINIAVGEAGVVDWTSRTSGTIDPDDVLIEKISIRDGAVRLHSLATDQAFEAEQINASVSARTLSGPWRVRGDLVLKGEAAKIRINTGRLREEGTISARINIQPQSHPYEIELDGPIGLVDDALRYRGSFTLRAAAGANASDGQEVQEFPYQPLPVRVSGKFDARPDSLKLPDFKLEVGSKEDPYAISGVAEAAFSKRSLFKVVAEGQQIDVDRLGNLENKNGAPPSVAERFAVLRNIAERVPVPPAEGLISLYLPAIVAGDTVVREVGVDILPKQNGWQLSNLDAGLPGRTKLQAHGLLSLGDDFGFDGQLLLASKQPSGFAAWLAGDVDEAIRRLPNAGFSARVNLNEHRVLMQKLEIVLGQTRLNGALERVERSGNRALLTTVLDGNNINVDTLQALFLLFVSDRDGARIFDHDMDIKLLSDNVSAFGATAKSVAAALKLTGQEVTIDQLEIGDFQGAKISASGRIRDALNLPDGDIKLAVEADNGAELLTMLRKTIGANAYIDNLIDDPALVDNVKLSADLKAKADPSATELDLTVAGAVGGTEIELDGRVEGSVAQIDRARTAINVRLTNDTPHLLLSQMHFPVLPLEVEGPMRLDIRLDGVPAQEVQAQFEAGLAEIGLSGKGSFDRIEGGAVRSRFDLALKAADIEPILTLSGYSFPGLRGAIPANLTASITSLGAWLSAKAIDGTIGEGPVTAKFTLDRQASPRPKFTGELSLADISLQTIAGLVMGESSIEGGTAWSEAAFTEPLFRGADAKIDLKASRVDLATGALGYARPGRNLTARLEFNDGDISLNDAQFEWLGQGLVKGDLAFARNQEDVLVSAKVGIRGASVEEIGWQREDQPLIGGTFGLDVRAEGGGASIVQIIKNMAGGGTVSVTDGTIAGLDPSALPVILDSADQFKDEDLEVATGEIADAALAQNPFRFDQVETSFSIAGGNLRIGDIRISGKEAELAGDLRLDLAALTIDGNARLAFDAGEEALTGATPEIDIGFTGPLANPQIRRDHRLLASFLTMRARERRERLYQAQKEEILENQRLVRMVRLVKYRNRKRAIEEQKRKDRELEAERVRLEQERLLKELEAKEEEVRQQRLQIREKQRQADEQRRQQELIEKQRQLDAAKDLERRNADLKRRQEAFEQMLREKKASEKSRSRAPVGNPQVNPAAPPAAVTGEGQLSSNLPGVFEGVDDKIDQIIRENP